MDVFLSTGERSGDVMAAAIARELQKRSPRPLRIAGLAGPLAARAGVENVFASDDLALVGVEHSKLRAWSRRLERLVELLRRRRPRVFVGITHCTFNLPLGGLLPEGTYRLLVGPPEIWAWQATILSRLLGLPVSLLLRLGRRPFHWAHALPVSIRRGPLAVENFDEVLCLLRLNYDAYRRLADPRRAPAAVRLVGHPLAGLHRTPALVADAGRLRRTLGVDPSCHVLGIFPGSRGSPIARLLPTMLDAAVRVLNARADVHAVVSVADTSFEAGVSEAVSHARRRLRSPQRLTARQTPDASVLLAACSHALLSSGTIALQAGCLATPGTVAYTLRRWRLLRCVAEPTEPPGPALWALPNAIVAARRRSRENLPYPEFFGAAFRARVIAASIRAALPGGPYRADEPPALDAGMVAQIRSALQPSPQESAEVISRPGPAVAVAQSVLQRLERA